MHARRLSTALAIAALGCQTSGGSDALETTCAPLRSPEARERLLDLDPSVRRALAENGRPDFLCTRGEQIVVVDTGHDAWAEIDARTKASSVSVESGIPGEILALLPERDRRRAGAAKAAASPDLSAASRRDAAPAAVAPRDGVFDVDSVVSALSRTTSFGAAGLSGWTRSTAKDGLAQRSASDGAKVFEVRSDRAAVSAPLDPRQPHTVAGASMACGRLNEAVFGPGSDADPANRAAVEILYAVATDPSGRRVSRRVGGRTLTAVRVAAKRVRYEIRPR